MDSERQEFDIIEISDTDNLSTDSMEISDTEIQSSDIIGLSDTTLQPSHAGPCQFLPKCEGDTEYDDAFLKHLPYIKKKQNIKKVFTTIHKLIDTLPTSKKCEQCKAKCTFCKYHVDMMDEVVNDEASEAVCQATHVGFIVYCIACDQVWISFTEQQFKNVHFGFHGYKSCGSEQGHNKRNVRYMMIDHFGSENSERMSFWENYLGLIRCGVCTAPELDACEMFLHYHYMHVSDMIGRFLNGHRVHAHKYDSENIVYLIVCNNCDKKYVGKTKKRFIDRYPSVLSKHQEKSSVYQHYNGEDCTVRDYRWTVLDALSDDQIGLLDKWRFVFNKCETDVKKKIWAILMLDPWLKDFLIEVVWQNEPIDVIKLIAEMDIRNEDHDQILESWYTANDDAEITLRSENEKWIQTTKNLFLEDSEAYWMTQLQTLHDGLNKIKSSISRKWDPNLYNHFFKSMGNNRN